MIVDKEVSFHEIRIGKKRTDTMPGNTKGHFAKYVSIRQTLEREIISGSFPDGSLLPPEHKLAAMFGVGRGTLRLALKELRQQGFVESRRGAKSRVRDISRNCRKLRIVWLGNAEWSEYEPLLRLIVEARTPELMAAKRDELLKLIRG